MSGITDYLGRYIATVGNTYKLPELGISEKITGSSAQTQPLSGGVWSGAKAPGGYVTPTFGAEPWTTTGYPTTGGTGGTSGPSYIQQTNPGGGGGAGSSRIQQLEGIGGGRNPDQETEYRNLLNQIQSGQEGSANDLYAAENQRLNTQYDQLMAQLGAQKGEAGTTYAQTKGDIETAYGRGKTGVQQSITDVESQYGRGLADALRTYQDTQRTNRMMARGLGILPSSAYMDIQSRAGEGYADTRANLITDQTNNVTKLNQELTYLEQDSASNIAKLGQQYQSIMDNIAQDERFTERQRNDALSMAVAERNQRISDIQTNMANWKMQFQQYADSVNQSLANASSVSGASSTAINSFLGGQSGLYGALQQPFTGASSQGNMPAGYIAPSSSRLLAKKEEEPLLNRALSNWS